MQINVQARNFSLTEALRSDVEKRIRCALSCFGGHVQRVVIRLSNVAGPRGGADKRCQLRVALSGLPDVVVEDTEADLYIAVDRARRTLVRSFERRQAPFRQGRTNTAPPQQTI